METLRFALRNITTSRWTVVWDSSTPLQSNGTDWADYTGKLPRASRTASAPQMLRCHEVPTLERLAIRVARWKWDLRVAKLLVRGWIRRTIVLEVTPRRLDSIMKGATLQVIAVL